MKKKLLLMLVMTVVFAFALTFAVSAESVHNENTVDYNATVTLEDGTVLPLYDENKEALIWYIDGKDADGKVIYSSALTEKAAKWHTESWDEVTNFGVTLEDGTTIANNNIVVVNMMDDDVVKNSGPGTQHYGKPVTDFKNMVQGRKNLEYFYLRLDTGSINNGTFSGCSKLKYINLENLTQLKRMAQNSQFSGCTSLFDGQVLDLSKTQLTEFEGSGTFSSVPFKAIKFPETMVKIGSGTTFINCTKLETVSIGNKAKFCSSAFEGCTSLKAIYYVGTAEELSASTISSVVANATIKSYTEYKALSDKSGVYIVYDYSRCEAFNNGVHGEIAATNACVGVCSVCNDTIVNHTEAEKLTIKIEYSNYAEAGTKTTTCQNESCTYRSTTEAPALFTCQGYSVPTIGVGGIAIGFMVNNEAIAEYTRVTGIILKYGVFAVSKDRLGDNDVFGEDGTAADGVINAEIKRYDFIVFELKIVGFADEQKGTKLAMGAYVAVTDGETTEYSYIQGGTPAEGENYYFASYNDIVSSATPDDGLTE